MGKLYNILFRAVNQPGTVGDFTQTLAFLPVDGIFDESAARLENALGFALDEAILKKLKNEPCSVLLSAPRLSMHLYKVCSVKADHSLSPGYFRNELAGAMAQLQHSNIALLRVIVPEYEFFQSAFPSKKIFLSNICRRYSLRQLFL